MLSTSAVRALRDAAYETLDRTRRHGFKLIALALVFIVLALLTRQRGESDLDEIDVALELWSILVAIFLGSIFGGALLAGWHLRRRASAANSPATSTRTERPAPNDEVDDA